MINYLYRNEDGETFEHSSQWKQIPIKFKMINLAVIDYFAKRLHYYNMTTNSQPHKKFDWRDIQILSISYLGHMTLDEFLQGDLQELKDWSNKNLEATNAN